MSGVAGVLLAAGASTRFRAADPAAATKLVAELAGEPLVRHVARAGLAAGLQPLLVVTGFADAAVRAALAGLPVSFAHNPGFADGLAGSLRVGLEALPPDCLGAFVLLGDMPSVSAEAIGQIVSAFRAAPHADAVVPLVNGRRGNPVLLARSLFGRACRLTGDEGARRLLAEAQLVEIPLDQPGLLEDIDDPAALAQAQRSRPPS